MLVSFPLMLLASLAHDETQGLQSDVRVQAEAPQSEIVVRGKEVARRAVLGSRLPRLIEPDPRGFVSQVASETGVAGLTPQSGMDPFAGGTRKVTVKTCKASDSRITLVALCDLALAQKGILDRDFDLARGAIDRVLTDPKSGQADKFFAHRFAFQIATLESDSKDQSDALAGMLASGLLSFEDRILARKTLASMAIARGDDAAAITELERLLAEAPNEAKAQANLSVLYARGGRHDRARPRIKTAVRLTAAAGQPVPKSWSDYLVRRQ
ncbi:MAG: bacterial transcriptional activator domain-containing protein [Pseudomonadota bacterium]|nr:bacterial transcriptional activator domain-containing protein [Pseudomonadota bacterium]